MATTIARSASKAAASSPAVNRSYQTVADEQILEKKGNVANTLTEENAVGDPARPKGHKQTLIASEEVGLPGGWQVADNDGSGRQNGQGTHRFGSGELERWEEPSGAHKDVDGGPDADGPQDVG